MAGILPAGGKLAFSVFTSLHAKDIHRRRATWDKVCDVLRAPPELPSKASCPLIKLASFGDTRTAAGSLRSNGNMFEATGVEGDYDAGQVSIQQAADMLRAAGVECCLYSSPSSTPTAPRWRVLAPLSRPYPPQERRRFVQFLNDALGGILAPESFTPSQAYYFGCISGAQYEFVQVHGQRIDFLAPASTTTADAANAPGMMDGLAIPAHLRGKPLDKMTRGLLEGKPKKFTVLLRRSIEDSGKGCAQIKFANDNQHALDEPRWRSTLSIAKFCEDGPEAIHMISRHHPGYDEAATIAKADLIPAPHTCKTFMTNWPEHCKDCKHKITSPIQLGIEDPTAGESQDLVAAAVALVREAEERAKAGDVGAPFESEIVAALRTVRDNDLAEFQRLRATMKAAKGVSIGALDEAVREDTRSEERTIADSLVTLAREHCELFHDADNEPHGTFMRDGHRECWHLQSMGFREWLSYQFYQQCRIAPPESAMDTALATLTGQAKFEGEERPVAVRVAKHGHDYYIDLCDEQWQAVRVTSSGWQVIQSPPVMFTRNKAMRALPMPVTGGDVDALWQFANIAPDDRMLVLAWIIEAYRPDTPYPVLELFASQGAAKSFSQSVLRELIDPNKGNLRAKPKTIDDLFVTAKASHVTSLENLSFLSPDFQDALCSLATGAGYGGRALYTNAEESVFEVKRPIIMNGISVVATRQDLIDRTLLVSLPVLSMRRAEVELQAEFARLKPRIFGALLDLFSGTLAQLAAVRINSDDLPRMADFAHLGEAVFLALGRQPDEFLPKYHAKRRYGVEQTIDASPVAAAALAWLDKNPTGFTGPLKQMHDALAPMRTDGEQWPRSVRAFGDALRRVIPALRVLGVDVQELGRQNAGYCWSMKIK